MTGTRTMWRKSSFSGSQTSCVEVAPMPSETGIRDSKNIDGGELRVPRSAWRSFVQKIATS